MKKILILGAGDAQRDLIEYCRGMDLEVHGLSYTCGDHGIPLLDHFAQINITDVERVREYFLDNKMDYIYSVGSDVAIPTVNEVAEEAGAPRFVSARTARICCSKTLMRQTLGASSRYNLPFACCSSPEEMEQITFYPAMLKPTDSQGQRGVFRVNNAQEAKQRFPQALAHSRKGEVIVEKYIEGDEISVNAYVVDGRVRFYVLSDRESFSGLPGGIIKAHHLPSKYSATPVEREVEKLVDEAVERLSIRNGPVYFQIKIFEERPYIIEVTPRLDGCHMWKLIEKYCGVNLLRISLNHLIGGTAAFPQTCVSSRPWHTEFLCSKPNVPFDKTGFSHYFGDEKVFYYSQGETVKKMNGYMEKCGYRMFRTMDKVGLVGGSGMIGTAFLRMYGGLVDCVDISRKSGLIQEYSAETLTGALDGCDSVVILAAKKVNPMEKQTLSAYEINTRIVENTLEACANLGIENIVYLSSRCVYDHSQEMPVAEDGSIAPVNFYGISKYSGELLCEFYNQYKGFHVKILRLSQVIGNEENGFMVSKFIQSAKSGLPLTVYGKGIGKRDYIYVKDVCRAIYLALQKYTARGAYNIGSGIGTSHRELAEAAVRAANSESVILTQSGMREDESRIWLRTEKAEEELGFSCAYSLDDIFDDLMKEQRGG